MRTIEIAPKTIIFTVLFLLGIYLLWIIKDLLFSLLIAFILMSALRPAVRMLVDRLQIPRKLAAVMIYLLFILAIVFLVSLILPPILTETTTLLRNLPGIIREIVVDPNIRSSLQVDSLTQYLPNVTSQALEIVGKLFSNVIFLVSTLFFGFYFLMEENIIRRFLERFVSPEKAHAVDLIFEKAERRMSAWFWGELALMCIVGFLTFFGLNLIGMKYALALAVLAGLFEVVPNLGPTLSAIPAVLIGLSISPITGIVTLALYFIIQQLENTLIVPFVMKKAVGLDPIVTLIALIIGGKIGGVLGVLLAIPLLLFIGTFYFEVRKNKLLFENVL
ncbi:AI-2E family transporter [Candidatus Roizmanbacteria bacterium]|nr:AI-2E family transporter [Candidatus Roizmanbacteria bacterium]